MNDPRFLSLRRFGSAACVVAGLAAAVLATGCGGPLDNGRHRVSGRISFAGKPVTHGEIVLTPDGARGNSGPQGIAPISDGRYDTAGTRAPGVAPGHGARRPARAARGGIRSAVRRRPGGHGARHRDPGRGGIQADRARAGDLTAIGYGSSTAMKIRGNGASQIATRL